MLKDIEIYGVMTLKWCEHEALSTSFGIKFITLSDERPSYLFAAHSLWCSVLRGFVSER